MYRIKPFSRFIKKQKRGIGYQCSSNCHPQRSRNGSLRRRGKLLCDNKLEYQNASLDLTTFTLSTQKGSINLTGKEFELLRYLFEYPNFVATKENLILKAWGLNSEFESNNLEVYMSFLRKKLTHLDASFTIESVRGVGYRLSQPKA